MTYRPTRLGRSGIFFRFSTARPCERAEVEHADGDAVEYRQNTDHSFLKVDGLSAENLIGNDDLIVVLLVHERVAVGVLVEIREI